MLTAPASLTQTTVRELATDWTIPLFMSSQSIFIKYPSGKFNFTAYLEPVKTISWVIIVVFLLISPLFLFGVVKYSVTRESISIGDSFGIIGAAFVQMGTMNDATGVPARITLLW